MREAQAARLTQLQDERSALVNMYQRYKEDHRTGARVSALADKIAAEREYKGICRALDAQIKALTLATTDLWGNTSPGADLNQHNLF
jgi:hypothetical protein